MIAGARSGQAASELPVRWAEDVGYATPRVGVGVGAVIFDGGGRPRLLQRPEPGLWGLPVGLSEVGEAPAAGIAREVREVTTLLVQLTRLLGVYDCQGGPWLPHHVYNVVFVGAVLAGTLTPTDEAPVGGYFAEDTLTDLVAHHARAIRDAFADRRTGRLAAHVDDDRA